jgi:hypothetical protein
LEGIGARTEEPLNLSPINTTTVCMDCDLVNPQAWTEKIDIAGMKAGSETAVLFVIWQ